MNGDSNTDRIYDVLGASLQTVADRARGFACTQIGADVAVQLAVPDMDQ
jgi:hypothetical protein